MIYNQASYRVVTMIIGLLMLIGCASNDDDGISGTGMQGTVAVGKAVVNAKITIKGKTGKKVSATTDLNGTYNIDVLELTAPYIIKVNVSATKNLYSVALNVGTANVHPLTDVVIRNWFSARNRLIDDEFDHDNRFDISPTTTEIDAISDVVKGLMSVAYQDFNVANDFNFIQTEFAADQTGFDSLLDHAIVIVNANTLEIRLIDQTTQIEGYIVTAFDLNNELTIQDTTVPTLPEGLVAIAANQTTNIVVWNSAQDNIGVAGYHVYRDDAKVGTVSAPVFTDSGLIESNQYCYKIEAFDGAGNSSIQTAEICVTTLAQADDQAPDAPSGLAVTATTQQAMALAWTPSQSTDVVGYHINRRTTSPSAIRIATVVANVYSDFDLISNTQYCYTMSAFDAAGNVSAPSNEVCGTTEATSIPSTTKPVTTASPNGGSFVTARSVSLTCADSDGLACSSIYYTLDGTAPTTASTPYNGVINIEVTTTLKFFGVDTVGNQEAVNSVTFTMGDVACTDELSGTISEDTTISAECTLVVGRVSVNNNALLTIDAGATLVFKADARIDIRTDGALRAIGTQSKPILLTGQQQTPGYWKGIEFISSNDNRNELDYVTIEYGGSGIFSEANVILSGGVQRLKMSNSILRGSSNYGFEFDDDSIVDFSNNVMTDNEAGPGKLPANIVGQLDATSQYSGNTKDLLYVEDGAIDKDQTWPAIDVDYSVGLHSVKANWVIAAGAQLRFRSNGDLNVKTTGSLKAVGTPENRIVFTSDQPTPGYWEGIQFTSSNSIFNELNYVTIEYGGSGIFSEANVILSGGVQRLKMSNSILRGSSNYGFEFDDDSIVDFSNNVMTDNEAGPGKLPANIVGQLDATSQYSGNTKDLLYVENGAIDKDQTWPAIDVDYSVGSHFVEANLVIAAGAQLRFRSSGDLNVKTMGSLKAVGTPENRIVFTSDQPTPGYWEGIQFTSNNDTRNELDYVTIEYGGSGIFSNANIMLSGSDSQASVTNSIIRNSQRYGLWVDSDAIIDDAIATNSNTYENNADGDFFRAP